MGNLVRTTVTLPEELLKAAKITSVKEGKSLSELLRESLRKRLRSTKDLPPTKEELLSLAGTIEPKTPMFRNPSRYVRRLREESDEDRDFSG